MVYIRKTATAVVAAIIVAMMTFAHLQADELTPQNVADVQKLIQPQPGESLWMHIHWETNLNAARRKAAQLGKPLLIWAGGGSAPLGGC